ncbi:GtrA family protein [Sinomonas sp. RB5]
MTPDLRRPGPAALARLFRFVVVGLVNNAVGYGLFVVQSLAGVGHTEAMTVSYVVGMAVSFWGNRAWTFGHDGPLWPTVLRFLGANAVGYGVNYVLLTALVEGWGWPQIPAQLAATAVVAACTFTLMRLWVFPPAVRASRGAQAAEEAARGSSL